MFYGLQTSFMKKINLKTSYSYLKFKRFDLRDIFFFCLSFSFEKQQGTNYYFHEQ